MKQVRYLLLQLLVLFVLGMGTNSVAASAAVVINEENFPDQDFRLYVLGNIDKNYDSVLSGEEIVGVRRIEIDANNNMGFTVRNFRGIEYFTELEELRVLEMVQPTGEDVCPYGIDFSLDLSANTKLKTVVCEGGKITGLNLSGLSLLEEVRIVDADIPAQDLRGIPGLKRVYLSGDVMLPDSMPELTELSVRKTAVLPAEMPKLETLFLDQVYQAALDFHRYPNLSRLAITWSRITELDLHDMKNLKSFSCAGSTMGTINFRGCSRLETLDLSGLLYNCNNVFLGGCVSIREFLVHGQPFSEMSIGDMVNLEVLHYMYSGITELDLSNNEKLKIINLHGNKLTDVTLSPKAVIDELCLSDNQFTKLDLRGIQVNTVICERNLIKQVWLSPDIRYKEISLNDNKLTALDLRKIKVETVRCQRNNLKKLLLPPKGIYKEIAVDQNGLTTLDLRKIKAGTVTCQRNDLKKLLLSPKGNYKKIAVDYNFLTKVDLRNIRVTAFTCRNNMIRSLKVRKNRTIRELDCRHNKLKSLDVRQCKKLKKLIWYSGATKGLKKSKIRRK